MGGPNNGIFNQSAGSMQAGNELMMQSAGMSPQERQAQQLSSSAVMRGNRTSHNAAQGTQRAVAPNAVQRTMNQYLNPYQNQVLDQGLSRLQDFQNESLNNVRGQAAGAGAYGGARHALLEQNVIEDSGRQASEFISNTMQSGFDRAAQLGQGQQQLEISGNTALANIGNNRQAQQQAAANFMANLGNQVDQRNIQVGNQLFNQGNQGLQIGQQIIGQQAQAGADVRALQQQILDQSANQFNEYANWPMTSLGTAMAGVAGNPLSNAGTTTSTTRNNPGLLSYLGMGAGIGSRVATGGKAGGK